jgi:hypothetical protein
MFGKDRMNGKSVDHNSTAKTRGFPKMMMLENSGQSTNLGKSIDEYRLLEQRER